MIHIAVEFVNDRLAGVAAGRLAAANKLGGIGHTYAADDILYHFYAYGAAFACGRGAQKLGDAVFKVVHNLAVVRAGGQVSPESSQVGFQTGVSILVYHKVGAAYCSRNSFFHCYCGL